MVLLYIKGYLVLVQKDTLSSSKGSNDAMIHFGIDRHDVDEMKMCREFWIIRRYQVV